MKIRVTINGKSYSHDVEPRLLLIHYLREVVGLTGSHVGCETSLCGLQCGFCTPGMIMASKQILDRTPKPTEEEIRHGLEGNVCRCTGYQHIVNAVKAAAAGAGK